ncbi:hypothetical protein [Paraburkholderia aspalathi]|uniref:hypothetical protein n=1 Tax=Paraburkholderia aspalathi TaxID=1324617 RepID=UPI003C8D280A
MRFKTVIIAALLVPSFAFAQATSYDPATGQRYDQYGRPLPSLAELCREGQMAGGPITFQCAQSDLRFNRKGERLVRYHFDKWGYDILDNGVTESEAQRLDTDPVFRAKYIKQHGYDKYKMSDEPPVRIAPFARDNSDKQCHAEADIAHQVAQASAQGIPIETARATVTKVLSDNHVSTVAYNDYVQMVYRAYSWQKHGYTLEQIRDADFQACKGTPVSEVPDIDQ